jgi:hypothetical protein
VRRGIALDQRRGGRGCVETARFHLIQIKTQAQYFRFAFTRALQGPAAEELTGFGDAQIEDALGPAGP